MKKAFLLFHFRSVDDNGLFIGSTHCPILVIINVEIGMVILSPMFMHSEALLHIHEIQEFILCQRTFASHDILVRCPRHRLGKCPVTTSYHIPKLCVVNFSTHCYKPLIIGINMVVYNACINCICVSLKNICHFSTTTIAPKKHLAA